MPMLPLELTHPRYRDRFEYKLGRSERLNGIATMQIQFEERVKPTLIKTPDKGADMPTTGTVWVEPATGRVFRGFVSASVVETNRMPITWTLRVDFVEHRDLAMLVPSEFEERFFVHDTAVRSKPVIGSGKGRARYSNFRRFTTSARIVPQ